MAISHINGVALSGLSEINGISSISAINGISASLGGGGVGDITVDLHQTFEFATVDQTSLEANDNNVAAVWSVIGTPPTTNVSAEKATISDVNGVSDAGTLGLVVDNDVGGTPRLDLFTYPDTQSVGFWVKTAPTNNTYVPIYSVGEGGGESSSICYVRCTNTSSVLAFTITGTTTSSDVVVSTGTWYWITVRFTKNGDCKLRVYNDSGSLVGSEQTVTGNNLNPYYHGLGGAGTSAISSLFDDFVVNYSTAPFPLGP